MPDQKQRLLRTIRRAYNLTQREVARAVGLTPAMISYYELSKSPSPEREEQIMDAMRRLHQENQTRPELPVYGTTS